MASDKKDLAVRLERIGKLQAQLDQQLQALADKSKKVATGIEQVASDALVLTNRAEQSSAQIVVTSVESGNSVKQTGLDISAGKHRLIDLIDTVKLFSRSMTSAVSHVTSEMQSLKESGTDVDKVLHSLVDIQELSDAAESSQKQFSDLINSVTHFSEYAEASFDQAVQGMNSLKQAGLDSKKVIEAFSHFHGLAGMAGMEKELNSVEGTVKRVLPLIHQMNQAKTPSELFSPLLTSIGLEDLGENLNSIRTHAGETRKELRKTSKLTMLLFAKIKRGDSFGQLMAHSGKLAGSVGQSAGKISGLSQTISQALEGPAHASADFADKISTLAKTSNATKSELKQLSDTAKTLGLETSVGTGQTIAGMQALADAGVKAGQIQAVMPEITNIGKASGNSKNLAMVSSLTAKLMDEFDIVPEKMGQLSDVLVTATNTTGMKLSVLGETMRDIGPVARQSGMNLKETAAMAGLLADMGLKGADAGASLEKMSARLAAPSDAAAATLQRLGIRSQETSGKMRNTAQIIGDVIQATKNMSPEEQQQVMQDVMGTDMGDRFRAGIQQGGKGTSGFHQILKTKSGAASEVADGIDHSLQGGINKLSAVVESIQLKFGDLLLPVKDFADSVASSAQNVAELAGNCADFIDNARSVYQAVQDLQSAYPKLGKGIGRTMRRMRAMGRLGLRFARKNAGSMVRGLMGVGRGVMRLIPSSAISWVARVGAGLMRLATFVFPIVISGIRAIGIAVMMNPIGLLLTAIAAVAVAVYYYWEPIKKYMKSMWAGLTRRFRKVVNFFRNFSLSNVLKNIREKISNFSMSDFIENVIVASVKARLRAAKNFLVDAWNYLVHGADKSKEKAIKRIFPKAIFRGNVATIDNESLKKLIKKPVSEKITKAAGAEAVKKVTGVTGSVSAKKVSKASEVTYTGSVRKVTKVTQKVTVRKAAKVSGTSKVRKALHSVNTSAGGRLQSVYRKAKRTSEKVTKAAKVTQKVTVRKAAKVSGASKVRKALHSVKTSAGGKLQSVYRKAGQSFKKVARVTNQVSISEVTKTAQSPKIRKPLQTSKAVVKTKLKPAYKETLKSHLENAVAKQSEGNRSIPGAVQSKKHSGHETLISINQLDIHVQGNDSMNIRDLAGEVRRQFMELMDDQKMKYRSGLYDY